MSTLIFKLTAAGLAALVNAANDGTQARTVVSVGVTATAIAPGDDVTDEIKRIATIAGEVVADDTIHVTVRDDGSDTYTVRGFGLYLDNGVLLGSYGQATPIIEKSSASILMLAVDARVLDASADISTLLFGDASFTNPPATTTRQGVVELATAEETATGTDASRAVVPASLKPLLDAKQPLDATLTAIAALVTAANQLIYATGPDTFSTTALSGFMRTLLDDADAATARTTLGAQPLDSTLTALAALATAADKLIYATGVDTFATATLTAFARTLLDDADATAARATLGAQPLDATLTALAAVATVADRLIYATGSDAFATTVFTAFARTLLAAADAAAARTTLGAAPLASPGFTGTPTAPTAVAGTNTTQLATTAFVQAALAALVASSPATLDTLNELAAALGDDPNFATTMTNALAGKQPLDATLTALAAVATAADKLIYATGADTFATATLTAFGRSLLDDINAAAARTTLGLGDLATLSVGTSMPSSLTANGYQKLPSGLILQWGSASLTASTQFQVTLPLTFPNAHLNSQATGTTSNGTEPEVAVIAKSLSSITLITDYTQTAYWLSIGY